MRLLDWGTGLWLARPGQAACGRRCGVLGLQWHCTGLRVGCGGGGGRAGWRCPRARGTAAGDDGGLAAAREQRRLEARWPAGTRWLVAQSGGGGQERGRKCLGEG